ncbi:hypothetical protein [Mycobacterium genavense]|uniref:hypothetical protein n=1 Tax=Mycobacterium genavense TaxID=36812 RepID=UPI000472E559|nr:hypothetical protein [Mycobacterium genavense]
MTDLPILQALRLKGRADLETLAGTLRQDSAEVAAAVERLGDAGLVVTGKTMRITPEGRARLEELLTSELGGVDQAAIKRAYDEFRSVNAAFKELVSNWQLKDGLPNAHDDSAYDGAILERLEDVHRRTVAILEPVSLELPRLSGYLTKLSDALVKIRAGETSWLTRPVVDSYHTVWFELHEELIRAAGLTRQEEAEAGHA